MESERIATIKKKPNQTKPWQFRKSKANICWYKHPKLNRKMYVISRCLVLDLWRQRSLYIDEKITGRIDKRCTLLVLITGYKALSDNGLQPTSWTVRDNSNISKAYEINEKGKKRLYNVQCNKWHGKRMFSVFWRLKTLLCSLQRK